MHVIVVGGGIVGTAAAAFLAQAGARVTLVEREGLASGASGANSGVVQHPFDPVLAALYRATVTCYRDLSAADAGFRLAAEPNGMLYVSADGAAVTRLADSLGRSFPDLAVEVVDGPAIERLEPSLAGGLVACRVGIGFPVQPGASTYAYATLAERHGATVRLGREAALARAGMTITGVIIDGTRLQADAVLVAAGPWTSGLLDPAGRWAAIRPRWGVVVETDLPRAPHHVLEEAEIDAAIGVPAPPADDAPGEGADPAPDLVQFSLVPTPGVAAVGSTFLAEQPDAAAWVEPILLTAARFVPGLAEAPIRGVRSCARPQSSDGRPLVGRVPGRDGLFVCAGHGPWGISTGPASARLVADLILGREPEIPAGLDPGRFGRP